MAFQDIEYSRTFFTGQTKPLCRHALHTYGLSDFEGSFDNVIAFLMKEKAYYQQYLEQEQKFSGRYNDDANEKTVKFNRVILDIGTDYDGDSILELIGERDLTESELAAFSKEEAEREAHTKEWNRKQYELLKKEFEG